MWIFLDSWKLRMEIKNVIQEICYDHCYCLNPCGVECSVSRKNKKNSLRQFSCGTSFRLWNTKGKKKKKRLIASCISLYVSLTSLLVPVAYVQSVEACFYLVAIFDLFSVLTLSHFAIRASLGLWFPVSLKHFLLLITGADSEDDCKSFCMISISKCMEKKERGVSQFVRL